MQSKIEYYKNALANGSIKLDLKFENNTSEMNFANLLTTEVNHYSGEQFSLITLNVDKVAEAVSPNEHELIFSKENLFNISEKNKTISLIEFILKGNKVIPPILVPVQNNLIIRDGNHRLALARFLKFQHAPFLAFHNHINQLAHLK